MTQSQIILCADDFGQNSSISLAISELIAMQRISATSCMTTTACWTNDASLITPYIDQIDIGLHFNLTHKQLITRAPYEHKDLVKQCWLRKIDKQILVDELNAQLDCFAKSMKKMPDFIDGHQHIQQLPIVRDALLEVYLQRLKTTRPYIRVSGCFKPKQLLQQPYRLKNLLIHLTGANKLKTKLIRNNIPFVPNFTGVYDFSHDTDYPKFFKKIIATAHTPVLIMCHPGHLSDEVEDTIREARVRELAYFKSQQMIDDLTHSHLTLCRYQDIL